MTPTPLSTVTPSAVPERPTLCPRSHNSRPPPSLILDDVQVDRIAIMRRRHAKSMQSNHLPHRQNHPLGSRVPLCPSSALLWTTDNRAQAELSTHRMAGAPSAVGGPLGWRGRGSGRG